MFLNMSNGRILEEIIRNETRKALEKNSNFDVYKVEFNNNENTPCGEYDMLIYSKSDNTCQIYEIKHSKHISKRQGHWLKSTSLNQLAEYFFGNIKKKAIIYMGDNNDGEIQYINANNYLQNINDYIF
ncbi:MAG: hypothetical protein IJU76_15080 [Desulfovibrionaceae bacterium]|nr:hypothetical protein [Desulfovibrionaceae bacterium]